LVGQIWLILNFISTETNNIFDTKIASKLARSYSDNHSLKTLIKEFINIDISKQFQSSDFGGELTPAQLKYCANDVIYLHKIHLELNNILEREKRLNLYKDCLKFLKTRVELDLAMFKDDIWSH
jgi:ribonuclease D